MEAFSRNVDALPTQRERVTGCRPRSPRDAAATIWSGSTCQWRSCLRRLRGWYAHAVEARSRGI